MFTLDSSLGIEIRDGRVVFTIVKRHLNGLRVGQSYVVEDFLQQDKAQLRAKVEEFRKHSSFNKENVILGLPRNQVILRQLELPLEAAENLSQLVRYQVEYFQPSDESASYFDHLVVRQDLERKRLILLVALVRKDWLDPYLERLWANKITPRRVEISTSAIFHLVALKKTLLAGKDWVVVFDINESASEIVALKGKGEIFSRELAVDAAVGTVDYLLDQLQQFFSQIKVDDGSIDRFYFSGTQADKLYRAFKERFKETERLADAIKEKLQLKESGKVTNSVGFALAPFYGKRSPLSLNLMPPEHRKTVSKMIYLPTALLALLLIAGALAFGLREYIQDQEFAEKLDAQIAALETRVGELRKIQTDIESTKAEIVYLEEITRNRTITMDVMKELTEKMPQEAYLQMLTIDTQAKSVDITGYSSNPTAIQNVLLRSARLQKVENKYTTFDQRVKKDRFNFRAEIRQ